MGGVGGGELIRVSLVSNKQDETSPMENFKIRMSIVVWKKGSLYENCYL